MSIFFCFFLMVSPAFSQNQPSFVKGKYQYSIIKLNNNNYGYLIVKGKKTYIYQKNIPGVAGNNGFSSKADAEKCAKLVVKKMAKTNALPAVTKQELINLNIKF